MLRQIEGSQAVAEAVALCRPEVICAYPISPQTHIVEALGRMVADGRARALRVHQRRVRVRRDVGGHRRLRRGRPRLHRDREPGPALHGRGGLQRGRSRSAHRHDGGEPRHRRADQHLERSHRFDEPARLRLDPAFAEDNQEALDLHIQAFRLGEELSLPVMVCMDGFILTHAYERVDIPTQEQVDAFLPRFEPRQVLDPADPVSIGAMVGPEAFMEVRYLAHAKQQQALELIPAWADQFHEIFGRGSGGLLHLYRAEDAELMVVALGSVLGTVKDTVDEMRSRGAKVGVLGLTCFRPWPHAAVRAALGRAKRVVVLEKSLAVGLGRHRLGQCPRFL